MTASPLVETLRDGPLPRLHLVTDDALLATSGFVARAATLLERHGPRVAVHVRGHRTPARRLYDSVARLLPIARDTASLLVVNDRLDVAAAAGCDSAQLGRRSLPLQVARKLVTGVLGYSAHAPAEAAAAAAAGADFILLGSVWRTPSHPARTPIGVEAVRATTAGVGVPVLGIGGVAPERVPLLVRAGAFGAAVLSGVWSDRDAVARVADYLAAFDTSSVNDPESAAVIAR